MLIYGLDFTSAPRPRKPQVLARTHFEGQTWQLAGLLALPTWAAFEAWLQRPGQWQAGLDLPFGLPLAFLRAQGWENLPWAGYVAQVAARPFSDWAARIQAYSDSQPPGQKLPRRECDQLAGAISPLMLHRVPLARMFYQGAPRLLASGAEVWPLHPGEGRGVHLMEVYPAWAVSRALGLGRLAYKSEDKRQQTPAQARARAQIWAALAEALAAQGLRWRAPLEVQAAALDDPSGDSLDAVLAAYLALREVLGPSQPRGGGTVEGHIAGLGPGLLD
jgi:hypothetical protein